MACGSPPEQRNTKTDRRHDMSDRVREKFTTQVRLETLSAVQQIAQAEDQRRYWLIRWGWKQGAAHFWSDARDQGGAWFVDKPRVDDLHPAMKPVDLERAIRSSSKRRGAASARQSPPQARTEDLSVVPTR